MISSDLAYIVHRRPYRETSQLIDVLGREAGRFSLVFKGARKSRRPPAQPFCMFQLSWSGKSDLKTLRTVEAVENRVMTGKHLYIGLYLNELLMRLLREGQTAGPVFDRYHHLVQCLADTGADVEPLLRSFEYLLLEQTGYGFPLDIDTDSGEPVVAGRNYRFEPQQGLVRAADSDLRQPGYPGEFLLAMAAMNYTDERVRIAAKQLMREALQPHLGNRPLFSRELYRGWISQENGLG